MSTLKKNDRQELFKKAMLARGKRALPRRAATDESKVTKFPQTAWFLWLAFALVSGYMLFFSPTLSVSLIEVRGESILPHTEYEALVTRLIEEKYVRFVPKSNFFLLPIGSIEKRLSEDYPKISRVSLRRIFPSKVEVYIDEAPLLFRWCSGGPCYGVREGKIIDLPAAENPLYDDVRLSVVDESALPLRIGDDFSAETYFENFRFFYQELPAIIPTKVEKTAFTPSRYSQELVLLTEEGWQIRVSVERSAESSLRALQLFLDEYQKDHPDRKSLSSVDLRVEGKIFFADKAEPGEEMPPGNTEN